MNIRFRPILIASVMLLLLFPLLCQNVDEDGGPFSQHALSSTKKIDHTMYKIFLAKYVNTNHPSGINLVRYSLVTKQDKLLLKEYIRQLESVPISRYQREEQLPFWINLYNAVIIDLILDRYPVKSIEDITLGTDRFSWGPWDAGLVTIENVTLSLNDIRHGILMSVWKDPRIHYALCNGSVSAPDINPEPFTRENTPDLLNTLARNYINHIRGSEFVDGRLTLSSMYSWYMNDFGGTELRIKEHIMGYVSPTYKDRIRKYNGTIAYRYDWNLNGE